MRDPDRSNGAAITDWSVMTVDQMWAMVSDHRPDHGWSQASAWDRTRELVDHHLSRIQQYRDELMRTWHPETSPAAAVYFGKIEDLVNSMAAVCDTAAATGSGLSHVNASLTEAQAALAPVHQPWQANQMQLTGSGVQVSGSNGGTSPASSPALVKQQTELHAQAVAIMSRLGDQTREGLTAMSAPPDYQPPQLVNVEPPEKPLIPMPDPQGPGPSAGGPSSGSDRSSASFVFPDGSPVLSGTPSGPPAWTAAPTAGSSGGPPPPARPLDRPAMYPVTGRVIGPLGPGVVHADDLPRSGEPGDYGPFGGPRRALPPGGLIGGAPFEGVEPGRPAPSAAPRANPPGGVIGPTTGRETEGMFAPPVAGGGARTADQRRRQRNPAYDSNEYWPMPKGVPPVIEPGPDPIHDPGPFIGPPP